MDQLIRELLVDVKQKGATQATKAVKQLGVALEDAAAAVELTNEQLDKMPKSLSAIERGAKKASSELANVKVGTAFAKSIESITSRMDTLISTMAELNGDVVKGFNNTAKAASKMSNNIIAATEKSTDQLITLSDAAKRAGGGLDTAAAGARRANSAIANTGGSSRGAVRQFADLARSGGGLTIAYAALAANIYVVKAAFDQLMQGDQLNRLNQFGVVIGSLTGVPVQNMAKALQEATGYAVSFEEAMKQATVASAYGFSTEQISQFALVARRAAAVLGIDMTDALNRVIKGVSKQEIELLDELGVTIRLNDAYTAYVKNLNAANSGITYNIQNLTSFQKQQAYANAVVAESTRRFGQLDGVLRATPWELFAANADSALRQVQMSAAKYLTPLIDSMNTFFYQSKAFQSTGAGIAQGQSNAQVDPNNSNAVVASLAASQEGYDAALKLQKESQDKSLALKKQYNDSYEAADFSLQAAVRLGIAGLPNNIGDATNKAWVDNMVAMSNQIERLNTEVKESQANVKVWAGAVNSAAITASKAAPGLQKSLGVINGTDNQLPGGNQTPVFDTKALAGAQQTVKAYESLKTTSRDTASSIATIGQSTGDAAKAAGGLKDAIETVKQNAALTGQSVDKLVSDLPLGFKSLSDMEKSYEAINKYAKVTMDTGKIALEAEQAKNAVLKAGGKTQAANTAAANVEAAALQKQVDATKDLIAVQGETPTLQKQLNELQQKQLQQVNSTYHDAKEIKDVTAKVVGLEEKLALLRDTSLSSSQYQTAELKLAVRVESERLAILEKQANKEKDIYNAKIAQAQAQRELRMDSFSNATTDATNAYNNAITQAQIQGLGQEATLTNDILATRVKIAAITKAAKDNQVVQDAQEKIDLQNELAAKEAELARMKTEKDRNRQNAVTSSLGGVGSSTLGMNGEDKTATEQANNLAYYDQSISKLSSLNSAATEAAQGVGNAIQQMANFAQGSVNSATLVASVAQSISSALSMTSANHVAAIDNEISAEQARDGKSAESQAKIKALENKKIQEQKKSAQKQIAIQTAVAVMMAAANPWPFPAIPMMAAAALAGALSYSQAGSASAPSASTSDNSASYLSIGERDKSVDVSVAANAGELSYVQGARGVGTANNFTPRAEGGDMLPGVSYLMGEHGAEVATPKIPMKVTPTDKLGSSGAGNSGTNVSFHVQALDAASFVDFMDNNKYVLRDAVESALNETGTSLNSLA